MEGNPHSVIEGMIIGAYAIGAHEGYIYVRDEYPLAVEHLRAGHRAGARSTAFWARTSWAPALTLPSRSCAGQGPLSAASRAR